jgi:choline transport protein
MAEKSEKQAESDREKGSYSAPDDNVDTIGLGVITEIVNASGHRDQLDRQYGILSICGMALTVDNAWVAIGTSLNVAICKSAKLREVNWVLIIPFSDNGGPPGVLYELLVACFYYGFIAASIAEVSLLMTIWETGNNTHQISCS